MLYQIATFVADGVGWDHMGGWGWASMITGWVLMTLLVAVVVWALIGNRQPGGVSRAIDVLDERYARGEIDRDEYIERRRDLSR